MYYDTHKHAPLAALLATEATILVFEAGTRGEAHSPGRAKWLMVICLLDGATENMSDNYMEFSILKWRNVSLKPS